MRAIVVRSTGSPEVLRCEVIPDPAPAAGEVVIKVHRCGVCFHEVVTRNGTLKRGVSLPCVPGHEIAGDVAAVGAGVGDFKVGDRVATAQRAYICGQCEYCKTGRETLCRSARFLGDVGLVGGYGEYVAVQADNVARIPDGLAYEPAAIAACTIGTLLNAVREVGHVKPGERVLVTGSSGGLGMHAIQLARLAGAEVLALTTSPSKVEAIRRVGADVVVVAERGGDFSKQAREATGGRGVDVVLDNVGTPIFHAVRRSLAPGGRWVLIGQVTQEFVSFSPAQLFLSGISLLSATSTTRQQLRDSLDLLARGKITPILDDTLPLEQAAVAHERMESGRMIGRILLNPQL
jgi:acryloyl-coenzyme A reductase